MSTVSFLNLNFYWFSQWLKRIYMSWDPNLIQWERMEHRVKKDWPNNNSMISPKKFFICEAIICVDCIIFDEYNI